MKKHFRKLSLILLFIVVFSISSCGKTAENEHLPEYCQTYSNFTSFASKDFYDLLIEQDIEIDKRHYLDAIATISLEFEVDDPNRDIDLSGIQCFQNLTDISLTGQSFRDLSPISALYNIQSIELLGTSVVSIDSFKNLSKIKSLVISDTYTLQSVDGVEEMTKLTFLDLSNNGIVNIEGLNNLTNLTRLYLNNNKIIEFPSINQLDKLVTLDISENDISILGEDLSGLIELKNLYAQNNEICDISSLDDLVKLEELNLSHNDLGCLGVSPDFDSLENAPNLKILHLDNNGLTSISGLEGRDISLETLNLNDNLLTDLSPISEYTDIVELNIENNQIDSISNLSGMTGLTILNLSHNTLTAFNELLVIPNVEEVNLSFNQIDSIPIMDGSWPNLTILDLSSNGLSDTSGIKGHDSVETLYLHNNGLTTLDGISELENLDNLVIFDDELEDLIPIVDKNPNRIRIINDSFYDIPELVLHVDNVLDFGFDFEDNLEIYGSLIGIDNITTFRFIDAEISVIDKFSLNLPNLSSINLSGNNLDDIEFILGNPNLANVNISNNPIENLSIFSGLTTSDLDNLVNVDASENDFGNNLLNAFIDLPSIETINLTDTSVVTINNSFNELPTLELLNIEGDNIVTIENSFNSIFEAYSEFNVFNFGGGRIGHISDSFNDGYYHVIDLENQSTILPTTLIDNSFNNLIIESSSGIDIKNSNFATITNSFNNLDSDILSLAGSNVETITGSFALSSIDTMDLSSNYIGEIPLLNNITSVEILLLNDNTLTTLAFLDSIPDLITLNISNQQTKDTLLPTLTSLNGVNGMSTLTTLIYSNLRVEDITGLKNIGITSFSMSYLQNDSVLIDTIHPDSFTGTPLTTLNLNGHELSNVEFLDNLDILTTLNIGVDLASLSSFELQDFNATLENLDLQNTQAITDFLPLAVYDELIVMNIDSPLTTVIHRLDGMDALTTLTIDYTVITDITESFNNMLLFDEDETFLVDDFSVLVNIEDSFNMYGTAGHTDTIYITPDILNIDNSFNNVKNVVVNDNNNEISPTFDTFSFDNIEGIAFEHGDYTEFSFLNGYTLLKGVAIGNLDVNITDLVNNNIENLIIINANTNVDTFTLDLATNATIEVSSFTFGTITFNTDASVYDVTALNADIVIYSDNPSLSLIMNVDDLVLHADFVTSIDLGVYETTTSTYYTDLLSTITRSSTTEINATTFIVNSNVSSLNYDTRATQLTISNNNAATYDVTVSGGNLIIDNDEAIINLTVDAVQLDVNYNELTEISLNGAVGTANITSTNFTTFDSTADITVLNIESSENTIDISGANITTINLTANLLTRITINTLGSTSNISTTNSSPLIATVTANTFNLEANSLSTLTVEDSSVISLLSLEDNGSLTTLNYGTATINTINIDTNQTTFSISGTSGSINLTGALFTSIDVSAANADLTVNNSAATLSADLTLDSVIFDNTPLSTLNMVGTSNVDSLTIENTSLISTVNTNGSTIGNLLVDSSSTSLSVDATNTTNVNIQGDSYTSLSIDAGTNNATINSSNSGILNIYFNADATEIFGNYSTLTIDTTSQTTSLNVSSVLLGLVNANAANVTTFNVTGSNADLDVNGTGIATLVVNEDLDTLDLTLTQTTLVSVTSTTGVSITTDTDGLTLVSSGDSSVNSSTLDDIEFNLGSSTLDLTLNKANLNITLDGNAESVILTGTDIDFITTTLNTDINSLELNNINAINLDFNTGVINNLDLNTTQSSITIDSDELQNINITGDNLSSVDVSSDNLLATLTVNSNNGNLTLSGVIPLHTVVNNDSLTTLSFSSFTTDRLFLDTDSLSAIDTGNSVTGLLHITTTELTFDLTSNASNINFNGPSTGTLDLTSTASSNSLDANNTQTITIDNNNLSNLSVDASNVDAELTINSTNSTLNVTGTIPKQTTINNDSLTALTFNTFSTDNLVLQTNALSTVDLGDTVSDVVDITSNQLLFTLSGNTGSLNYTGPLTGEINLTTQLLDNITTNVESVTLDIDTDTFDVNAPNLNDLDATSINQNTILTVTSTNTTLELSGSIPNQTNINNNNLTTLTFDTYSTDDLVLQTNSLNSLDTGTSVDSILDITSTEPSFTMSGDVLQLDYNGPVGGTLNVTSATLIDLNTLVSTLDLNITSNNLTITNNDLSTLDITSSNAVFVVTIDSTNTSLELSGSILNQVVINNDSLTTLTFNAFTTGDLELNTNSLATVNTGASVTGTLDFQTNQVTVTVSGDFNTFTLLGQATGTLGLTSSTVSDITTNTEDLILSLSSSNATVAGSNIESIEGSVVAVNIVETANSLAVDLTSSSTVSVSNNFITTLNISGSLDELVIAGINLTTLTTTGLTVNTEFTMNSTVFADLEFVSNDLLSSVDEITINSLNNSNIESIIAKLDGTTIILNSPITNTDVYNYYYNEEYTRLDNLETSNNARYDQFRTDAINDAWAVIVANQYMDHLNETNTKNNEIDAQNYQTVQAYYDSYLSDAGLNPEDVTPTEETNIKASIQSVIDDPLLTFTISDIDDLVSESIDDDAETYATNENTTKTYTLS